MSRQANPNNRPHIRKAIARGDTIKVIANDLKLSISWTYSLVQELGFFAALISKDEMEIIKQHRKQSLK